ncbi:hypothetical protein THOG05_10123 [Vibrio rotiferianus]|nr:hypothetical protein THOG05_10123 [Vibrio rotiferianus]
MKLLNIDICLNHSQLYPRGASGVKSTDLEKSSTYVAQQLKSKRPENKLMLSGLSVYGGPSQT